jgi:hypothetical protein
MKQSKLARTLTALAIALTLTAIAATTATAALPEFSYVKIFTPKFTLKGGKTQFEAGSEAYKCEASSGEGSVTGAKTATAKLTLTGCSIGVESFQSPGAKKGEVKTGTLPVELVYTSKASHEVGLVFNYEATKKSPLTQFASWEFAGFAGKLGVRGPIIAPATPVNTKTNTYTVTFSGSKGLQTPASYETEAGGKASAFPELALISEFYEQGAVENKWTLTDIPSEGEFEIKA